MEATPGMDRKGRPTVWGYVYGGGRGRPRLRWRRSTPRASPSRSSSSTWTRIFAGGRVYYEARPQTPGPAYRVTVQQVISNFNGAP